MALANGSFARSAYRRAFAMTLILFDMNGLAHRSFHAPGKPIGKFIGYVHDILADTLPRAGIRITHAAAIWDSFLPNWRHEIFPAYKSNRLVKPSGISGHIGACKAVCEHFRLRCLTVEGYEADDVIATYTRMAMPRHVVVIVSQDKDLMQLVRDGVTLLDHRTGRLIREGDVYRKFGVNPDRLHDLLALAGDVADGVVGVRGIGLKGGAELLSEYRSLHHLLLNADRVLRKSHREALLKHAEQVKLAYRLIELRDCRPNIPATLDELFWIGIDTSNVLRVLRHHGLGALAEKIAHAGRNAA
jgi:DNA polymerase-1